LLCLKIPTDNAKAVSSLEVFVSPPSEVPC
jgi:hypothetical protein